MHRLGTSSRRPGQGAPILLTVLLASAAAGAARLARARRRAAEEAAWWSGPLPAWLDGDADDGTVVGIATRRSRPDLEARQAG